MNENVNSAAPRTGKGRAAFWLLGILATFGLAVVVLIATLLFGQHGGEEFCPDRFTRRSFFYFQIPLVGIQVTPIFRDDTTNSLENYLVAGKFVSRTSTDNPRWDLVTALSAGSQVVRGDAEILCSYLDTTGDNGGLYWQHWSDTNPVAAKILWPLVAQLARQQLYLFVPELFELASAESDPKALARKLDGSLARQYLRLATIQQQLGHHDTARELLNHARRHAPDDPEIRGSHEAPRQAESKAGS
jgi:hypothetical protein